MSTGQTFGENKYCSIVILYNKINPRQITYLCAKNKQNPNYKSVDRRVEFQGQECVCTRITYLQRLRFGRSGMEPSNLTGITDNSNTISHFILCSINIPLLRPFGSSSNPPTQLMIFSPSPLGKQMGSLALIPFVFLLLKKMP